VIHTSKLVLIVVTTLVVLRLAVQLPSDRDVRSQCVAGWQMRATVDFACRVQSMSSPCQQANLPAKAAVARRLSANFAASQQQFAHRRNQSLHRRCIVKIASGGIRGSGAENRDPRPRWPRANGANDWQLPDEDHCDSAPVGFTPTERMIGGCPAAIMAEPW
jgi:hypothetical protein